MHLTPIMEEYVLHWGEMETRWGGSVNRSVAQIHALLYLSPKPMPAEEIAETLSIARSNVSTSLKELQSWGLARVAHTLGDRRNHFETDKDLWTLLLTNVEERKRREIDPTLTMLRKCMLEAETDAETPAEIKVRIGNTLDFIDNLTSWYDQVKRIPKPTLIALMKLGGRISSIMKLG